MEDAGTLGGWSQGRGPFPGDWHQAAKDVLAGFELYVFLGFLVYAILWVRRGTEHFETVLSSRGRQIAFLMAVFLSGVFIAPHLRIEPDTPCSAPKTSVSRR